MSNRRRLASLVGLPLALTLAISPVNAAPPSNDAWATPSVITSVPTTVNVDLTEATLDGDPQYCGSGTASVWYTYAPAADGFLTVVLAADPATGAIQVGVDDPFSFLQCVYAGGNTSLVVEAGHTYYFQVSTDGASTSFDLDVRPVIVNDRFSNAASIDALPATVSPDLTSSTSLGDTGTCASTGNGAWYRVTPDKDIKVDISGDAGQSTVITLTGPTMDDVIACIYTWNGGYRATMTGGSTYHLLVAAYGPSSGGTSMTLAPVPPPPANDAKADATPIGSMPFEVEADLSQATPDPESSYYCFSEDWATVWYAYRPMVDEILDADVSGGSGMARAAFFWSGGEDSVGGCTAYEGAGRILARAGTTYYVALGAPRGAVGPVGLKITSSPAPTINVAITSGSVELASGTAIINGTGVCSTSGTAEVYLSVRQRVGRTTLVEGTGRTTFPCGPAMSKFSVRVPGDGKPFGAGSAAVAFNAWSGEWPITAFDTGSVTVKLRGR